MMPDGGNMCAVVGVTTDVTVMTKPCLPVLKLLMLL